LTQKKKILPEANKILPFIFRKDSYSSQMERFFSKVENRNKNQKKDDTVPESKFEA